MVKRSQNRGLHLTKEIGGYVNSSEVTEKRITPDITYIFTRRNSVALKKMFCWPVEITP